MTHSGSNTYYVVEAQMVLNARSNPSRKQKAATDTETGQGSTEGHECMVEPVQCWSNG